MHAHAPRDVSDQAGPFRPLGRRRRRTGTSLAIVSGKGGVGKTNAAVNLAICAAGRGARVSLVDLDMGLANADLLLGVTPRYTLAQVIAGAKTLEDVAVQGPAGVRFIPGASGLHQLANLSDFERQNLLLHLRTFEDSTDTLIFDCGAGISRSVMRFALAAHRVMVVTTPEPTALTDAYATIKTISREAYRGQVGLLVNRVESRSQAADLYRRIADVSARFLNFSVAYFGFVLQDTAVVQAVLARSPVVLRHPRSPASACFAAVADMLFYDRSVAARRDGFFRRVAGLFV